MSTLPPASPLPPCSNCGGWGCRACRNPYDVAASAGGEQGASALELEAQALRNEAAMLRDELAQAQVRLALAHRAHARTARTVEQLAEALTLMTKEMARG